MTASSSMPRLIVDREDVMAAFAEPAREQRSGALIDQKTHLQVVGMRRHELDILKRPGGEPQAGLPICKPPGPSSKRFAPED